MHHTPATRAHGLQLMQAFQPRMGSRYAAGRNYDYGRDGHKHVSGLSPFIRHRLICEAEVTAAALAAHGHEAADRFIAEVFWRGYFKGWLEQRPSVWSDYVAGVETDLAVLDKDRRLRRDVQSAMAGGTGIACFDEWAVELVETGYLHNHARMWFASIWIFTLGLPWRLGADFFLRHLTDGDPASNTLGWRWVAGLHTRGKAYAAQGWNIAKFTGQRHVPRDDDFVFPVTPQQDLEPDGLPGLQPLRDPASPVAGKPTALLITAEDCDLSAFDTTQLDLVSVATLHSSHLRGPLAVAGHVTQFETQALRDAATAFGADVATLTAGLPGDLAKWAARAGAKQIVTPFVPQGPLRDWLNAAAPALATAGITLCEWQRDWDRAIWPHATAGFMKVEKKIPAILRQLGLTE